MNNDSTPCLIEPLELAARLADDNLLIVDVGARETYLQGHLPGAVHLDYNDLILGQPPAPGLLPPRDKLQATLRAIGVRRDQHIIAYDHQGNTRASRLLWTLEAVGHEHSSLLNGGLGAWRSEGRAIAHSVTAAPPSDLVIAHNPAVIADRDYVLGALGDEKVVLLDARTPDEYHGLKSPFLRHGHIPGAVNLNWLDTIDRDHYFRFKPKAELNAMLAARGIERDREIITYCQTHHRSSHSFVMLRHLGFEKIRGYPGSWSEWGNDPALPIE
ncbi:sulfurtransferase [Candidatus Spongiihabitans sp.]|uniref:sulfurtransferase n=1 Tax=Candidatus Spongiihabitans sp. TaxID=3101308 RepID=UPI003C7B1551